MAHRNNITMDTPTQYPRIISSISASTGKTEQEVSQFMEAFSNVLADSLRQSLPVFVPGLGKWESEKLDELVAVSPDDGKTYIFPPEMRVGFSASSKTIKYANHEL